MAPRSDALLVIDVLNDLEFAGAERVLPWAERMVPRLRAITRRFRRLEIPVIYVNDNQGLWRSRFDDVLARCTRRGARGREVTRKLAPVASDYAILKPRHSAFFATPLHLLLEELGVGRLFLSGIATNLCVLATAHDASMHDYEIVVLSDCCAAESDFDHDVVLGQLEQFFEATICRSDELVFPTSRRTPRGRDHTRASRSRGSPRQGALRGSRSRSSRSAVTTR